VVTANAAPSAGRPVVDDHPLVAGPRPVIGLMIASGVVTVVLGVAILAWPDVTLKVAVVLLAIHLFVAGVTHLVQAVVTDEITFGSRTFLALTGALSLLVGLLVLRSPLQTVGVVALIFGALLVVMGVLRIIDGFRAKPTRRWDVAAGTLSLLVGSFVMSQPELSLRALVSVVGLWQIAVGLLTIVSALALRTEATEAMSRDGDGAAAGQDA
jgi:uncharacterized membrane protein HdeD (DUF308 family)